MTRQELIEKRAKELFKRAHGDYYEPYFWDELASIYRSRYLYLSTLDVDWFLANGMKLDSDALRARNGELEKRVKEITNFIDERTSTAYQGSTTNPETHACFYVKDWQALKDGK